MTINLFHIGINDNYDNACFEINKAYVMSIKMKPHLFFYETRFNYWIIVYSDHVIYT